MRRNITNTLLVIVALVMAPGYMQAWGKTSLTDPRAMPATPLLFTENKGQVADAAGNPVNEVLFTAHNGNTRIYLTATGISYQFTKTVTDGRESTHRITVSLAGANPHPHIRKEQQNLLKENFFLAHCPVGITGVNTYERLVYENVYPGIDWVLYSSTANTGKTGSMLKYDFVLQPGADPKLIHLSIAKADKVQITNGGALKISTRLGNITEAAPVSFADGKKIPSAFRQYTDGSIGFAIRPLADHKITIDPAVTWATYYGGSGLEINKACDADNAGNVYFAGYTSSASAVAAAGFQLTYAGGSYDAFVVKFNAAGNRVWASYYGGSGSDYGYAFAADPNNANALYLGGYTSSSSGITANGSQNTYGGSGDAYMIKLDSNGIRQWATYYGGNAADFGYGCAVDGYGNPYLSGYTSSTDSIAFNGYQNANAGGIETFLVKFNAAGIRKWGTFFGGTGNDNGRACAAYGGSIYISGYTNSASGIAYNGHLNTMNTTGSADAFLARFDTSGNRIWGTYYGGTGSDYGYVCAAFSGGVCLSGYVTSSTAVIASANAYQTASNGGREAYLVKFDTMGVRQWGTFFGGAGGDEIYGCSVNTLGDIYISGTTNSATDIAYGNQSSLNGSSDAFLAKFNAAGDRVWGTYLGGNGGDTSNGNAVKNGLVYVTGNTSSTGSLATAGAFQTTLNGTEDGFIYQVTDPRVQIGNFPLSAACTGASIAVPVSVTGIYSSGNVFTAQLSDSSGSFAAPVVMGSLTATGSGTINATIPAATIAGTHYRIRLIASSPADTSAVNTAYIAISAPPAAPGSITGNIVTCSGSAESYTVAAVSNATSYTWTTPTGWTGTSTTNTLAVTTGITGGTITVKANNSCGSSATTSLTVNITQAAAPAVAIIANIATICPGTPVTFTATPSNGGSAPQYQWKKNGSNVGSNSNTYTDATLTANDTISVVLTSNSSCVNIPTATSNKLAIAVTPNTNPSVTITAAPGTTVGNNTPVTFSASISNGGSTTAYQWRVNAQNIAGATNSSFTIAGLASDDSVSLRVKSANTGACTSTDTAYSNTLVMHISTGINQLTNLRMVALSPNPNTGNFTITAEQISAAGNTPWLLEIVNPLGQTIYKTSFTKNTQQWTYQVTLNNMPAAGFYIARLRSGNEAAVISFYINR